MKPYKDRREDHADPTIVACINQAEELFSGVWKEEWKEEAKSFLDLLASILSA